MSSFKIAGKNGAFIASYADTDVALTPQTLQANSGQLTVQSASGNVILGTGATIPAGQILTTSGNGNINLPNNVTVKFQIEGVAVCSTVTAANLNSLTNGSNADSLHTHTNVQASALDLSGQTLWATPALGEVGYISGNNTFAKARANSATTLRALGVYSGLANTLIVSGKVGMLFVSGLTLVAGDVVYLSDATVGKVTNVEPSASGNYSYAIAIVLDATGYDNINGSIQQCVWDRKMPILIG